MKQGLLLLVFLGTAFACPRINTVADLDLQRYMGMWQIHGVVNTHQLIGEIKCYMNDLKITNSNQPVQLAGHLMYSEADGGMEMSDVSISVDFPVAPGYWTWSEGGVTSTAFIMFSDYVDYSLLLICRGNDVSHLEAHFMGRSHSPLPSGVVDNFKRMLGEYGIDVSSYRQVFHDGSCGH